MIWWSNNEVDIDPNKLIWNEVDIDNKWSSDLMKLILITNDLVI